MDFIPEYLSNRENPANIHYQFKEMKPYLAPTFGVYVYQEQIMQGSMAIAGYPMKLADELRTAVSKKKKYLMDLHKDYMINGKKADDGTVIAPGALALGHTTQEIEKLWNDWENFASYCFNKSHGCAYAITGYETAWFKYYYPVYYMASAMTVYMDNDTKIPRYVKHCKKDLGINISVPNIQKSGTEFMPDNISRSIYYPLTSVKAVKNNAFTIIRDREKNGEYENFLDMMMRFKEIGITIAAVRALIYSGACDCFGYKRSQLIYVSNEVAKYAEKVRNYKTGKRKTAPPIFDVELPDILEFPEKLKLKLEKEYTGMYVSGHPAEHLDLNENTCLLGDIKIDEEGNLVDDTVFSGMRVKFTCLLEKVEIKMTKKDELMAFLVISDITGESDVVVFPRQLGKYKDILNEGDIITVIGKLELKEFDEQVKANIICDRIERYEELEEKTVLSISKEQITQAKKKLDGLNGNSPTYLIIDNKITVKLPKRFWVHK